jgi:hypothetical protein
VLRWRRTLGGPGDQLAWGMTALGGGDYALAGQTRPRFDAPWSGFIARISRDGHPVWMRTLDRGTETRLFGVAPRRDGGAVFVGTRRTTGGLRHAWLVAVDRQGTVEWEREFGGDRALVAHSILAEADGGFLVTGYGEAPDAPAAPSVSIAGPRREQPVLQRLSPRGDPVWTMRAAGVSDERAISSIRTVWGDLLTTGYRRIRGEDDWDIVLRSTSADGVERWDLRFGGPRPDRGVALLAGSDGSVLVTGSVNNGAGRGNDLVLIRLRRSP